MSSGSGLTTEDGIEQYLQQVAETLRPFKAWEEVGDGIYLLRADDDISIGKKMTRELLSRGYAIESCHHNTLRVRRIGLMDCELSFQTEVRDS